MQITESVFAAMREQIDQRHREAIKALETIAGYLAEGPIQTIAHVSAKQIAAKQNVTVNSSTAKETRVDRVLGAIGDYKLPETIAKELDLTEVAVRAVLYAKAVIPKIQKAKIGGKLAFS